MTSQGAFEAHTLDCGLPPFSRDEKPNHGSPDFAIHKSSARLQRAAMAREELGMVAGV